MSISTDSLIIGATYRAASGKLVVYLGRFEYQEYDNDEHTKISDKSDTAYWFCHIRDKADWQPTEYDVLPHRTIDRFITETVSTEQSPYLSAALTVLTRECPFLTTADRPHYVLSVAETLQQHIRKG